MHTGLNNVLTFWLNPKKLYFSHINTSVTVTVSLFAESALSKKLRSTIIA